MSDATTQRCSRCLQIRPEEQFVGPKTYKFPAGKPHKTCNKCRASKVGQTQRPPAKPACEPGTKRCPQCSTTKPIEEFTGVRCTPCRDAFNAEHRLRVASDPAYRAKKLQHARESNRRHGRTGFNVGDTMAANCLQCSEPFTYVRAGSRPKTFCEMCRQYRQEGRYYGLTGVEVAALRARGACDICGSTDSGATDRPFRIDHCHETGLVRGLLCHPCNIAIGSMKDQPERLRAAAAYIEKHRAPTTGVSTDGIQHGGSQCDARRT